MAAGAAGAEKEALDVHAAHLNQDSCESILGAQDGCF